MKVKRMVAKVKVGKTGKKPFRVTGVIGRMVKELGLSNFKWKDK